MHGGISSMSRAQDLILRNEPLQESEISKTFDLFSEEELLGTLPPKKVKEAKISLGKWHINFIPPSKSMSSEAIMTPDRSKWDLYLIYIPFTLHEPPEGSNYQRIEFHVILASRDATALDLLPKHVTTKQEITKTYTLSPEVKFKEIEGGLGGISYQIRFESLRPILSSFGEGENDFYWVYTSQEGQQVFPGTKHALVVLEVPRATKSVQGTIYYQILMAKKWLGIWKTKDATMDHDSINWNLNEAKPLY